MADPAAAQAYRALEELIVTLKLAPGASATEAALSEATGFGRTPLREAIQRLAWEGLIEVRPRVGLVIAPLHASDWLRVIDARRGVEQVLAASAARFLAPAIEAGLRDAIDAMRDAAGRSDAEAFLAADKAMDEVVALAADNRFAARVAAPLQAHSRRFWFRFQAGTGLGEAAERHAELAEAILERDAASAGQKADALMSLLRGHAAAAACA